MQILYLPWRQTVRRALPIITGSLLWSVFSGSPQPAQAQWGASFWLANQVPSAPQTGGDEPPRDSVIATSADGRHAILKNRQIWELCLNRGWFETGSSLPCRTTELKTFCFSATGDWQVTDRAGRMWVRRVKTWVRLRLPQESSPVATRATKQ